MHTIEFLAVFPRQLRFWTLHCTLNALPSFVIAIYVLKLFKNPHGIAAMLLGIVSFIFIYAATTSLLKPLTDKENILHRAMKLGTKIRVWISLISLGFIPLNWIILTPDFWCGFVSVTVVQSLSDTFINMTPHYDFFASDKVSSFILIYATTMLEGFILSLLLMNICYFALKITQAHDRKKLQASLVGSENSS